MIAFKKNLFERTTHSWLFYHVLFWISYVATFSVDIVEYFGIDTRGFLLSIISRCLIVAALFYFNLLILIPKFLKRKKYFFYALLLSASILTFVYIYKAVYFISTTEVAEIYPANWLIGFSSRTLLALRILLISFLFDFLKGWFAQEKRLAQMALDKTQAELNYLRAQINPHFLFNTLNNIYSLALKRSDRTAEIVMRLSEMMEYMLYESDEVKVPLEKEINNLINYIEIEKIRQGNHAIVEFSFTGDYHNQRIVPLLLLPLVENAVKHGINKSTTNAYVRIELELNERELKIRVENNKSSEHKIDTRHGLGIVNLKKRLDLFYPQNHYLSLKDESDKFTAQLILELK